MLLLSGMIGALTVALITFSFNIWKFHRDERSARCDDLCDAIWRSGLLACSYWLTPFDTDDKDRVKLEAELLASQSIIDGLYNDFCEYVLEKDQIEIDKTFSDLIDALTGGDFSVPNHPSDTARASLAPRVAGLAIIAIRREHRNSIPFRGLIRSFHMNRKRELDMPKGFSTDG